MKLRLKQLEQRVIGEALGWHYRKPYDLEQWLESPGALIAHLNRLDIACASLIEERKKQKQKRERPEP